MITPTNGRQVWFHPNGSLPDVAYMGLALAATVVHVWSDRCVNLQVLDANGVAHQVTSVTLLQDTDAPPLVGVYAEWMPFQKGQAKAAAVPEFVQRMIDERAALAEKVIKLGEFISPAGAPDSSIFSQLPHIEQRLMIEQFNAMETYLQALSARLALIGR